MNGVHIDVLRKLRPEAEREILRRVRNTGGIAGGSGDVIAIDDWRHEIRYAVLMHYPEVLNRLAAAPEGAKPVSAEQWMELSEKIFKPLSGGIPVKTVAAIAAPLFGKMGIKTGKTRCELFADPPGQVMVEVLCAMTRNSLPLAKVHQGDAGCVFEAKLPSDFWAMDGEIVVSVERAGNQTKVEAATNIPGQLFDWGKSKALSGDPLRRPANPGRLNAAGCMLPAGCCEMRKARDSNPSLRRRRPTLAEWSGQPISGYLPSRKKDAGPVALVRGKCGFSTRRRRRRFRCLEAAGAMCEPSQKGLSLRMAAAAQRDVFLARRQRTNSLPR